MLAAPQRELEELSLGVSNIDSKAVLLPTPFEVVFGHGPIEPPPPVHDPNTKAQKLTYYRTLARTKTGRKTNKKKLSARAGRVPCPQHTSEHIRLNSSRGLARLP